MPVPGKTRTADRQDVEHLVVALERRGLRMLRPVGLEGDLRHLAVISPPGGEAFGPFRRSAMQQHHVRVLGADLVEPIPDQAVIVEVEAAGEGDLRPGGQ